MHWVNLRRLYVCSNISYRNTAYMMHRGFHVPEAERQEYAQMLKALIDSEKPVIYVDESSFNMWKRSSKTWAPRGSTIFIPIANSRNSSITVYGAIGTCLKQAVFMQHRSTCTEDFVNLLKEIRWQLIGSN